METQEIRRKVNHLYGCMMDYYKESFNKDAIGLYGINMGLANFFYVYSRVFNKKEASETADTIIEKTMASSLIDSLPSLASGLVGECFALNLLQKNKYIETELDPEIHKYLIKELITLIKNNTEWDFMHGFLGYSLYFIERGLLDNTDKDVIHVIVLKLKEKAEAYNGMYRYRRLFYIPGNSNIPPINDNYDISLSHGMVGIVLILIKIYQEKIDCNITKELIYNSINYILSTRMERGNRSLFPSSVRAGRPQSSRLAWCYGDLNVAWCLWSASKIFKENDWANMALDIFNECAHRRSAEETSVVDAGICHGSAGLAYFFKRVYEETGDHVFKETANFWVKDLMNKDVFEDCRSGYKYNHLGKWYESYTFLEGIPGIGLVLLSFLGGDEYWKKFILLD